MVRFFRLFVVFPFLIGLLGISGCNSWIFKYYFGDEFSTNSAMEKAPAQLAMEGSQKMRDKDYDDALKAFQQLKERYPYSKYAILAELKVGDAHFYKGDYPEAAIAYEEFARLHPRNEVVPYVLYQIGMCHFLSFKSVDRDQEETALAVDAFKRLIQSHPDSQYARKAEKQLFECQKRIAAHDFTVAKFYHRRGEHISAKQRLEKLIEEYPQAVEDLKYQKEIQKMLADSNHEVEKGGSKESIWTRIGF
jgi:outer membrane protein assembly factor BamD